MTIGYGIAVLAWGAMIVALSYLGLEHWGAGGGWLIFLAVVLVLEGGPRYVTGKEDEDE